MIPRLYKKYKDEIVPEMMKSMNYTNTLQVPKVLKVVINVGMGAGAEDAKLLEAVSKELSQITGQHAVITKAAKAISNFKLKKGSPVGSKVTLRRERMYEFLDRLINVALPSLKDFRGISDKAFDNFGNYTLGLTEQTIFPEIEYDTIQRIHGMDITIVTGAKSKKESYQLLKLMGLPFKR
ncbi:MAG: 50S ribosomal protein L5 [Candidatus Omnitrophica bacterium]|nr:50S ribosomal protein L5 [Candidatus Omnitrophota bacterium]